MSFTLGMSVHVKVFSISTNVRFAPMNEPASAGGAGGAVGRLRLPR